MRRVRGGPQGREPGRVMSRDANRSEGAKSRLAQALAAQLAKPHLNPLVVATEFVQAMWDEGWRQEPARVIRREDRPAPRGPLSPPTSEFRSALAELRERRNTEPEEQQ